MNYRTTWKRICSGFFVIVMLLTMLPTSALAIGYVDNPDARIVAIHKQMNSDNSSVTNASLGKTELEYSDRLNPKYSVSADAFIRENNTINVWVTSSDMREEEKSDYSVIPYVDDKSGNTWYLYQIMWANNTSVSDNVATGMVMSCQDIIEANSLADYQFNLEEITAEPKVSSSYSSYSIRYCWTTTPPEEWGTTPTPKETYSIRYETNLSGVAIYGYKNEFWDGGDQGITSMVDSPNAETVVEDRNFSVGDKYYQTYFAVKKEAAGNTYYTFTGWEDKTGNVHKPRESVTASSDLADSNKVITLTAQWKEISPLSDDNLENYADQLPITVFNTGSDIIGQVLITQWTDTDANTQYNDNTANPVTLDEDGTISYLVSAKISSGLTSVSDENLMSYSKDFAEFTFHVNVDGQLKFADLDKDGKATLTFESTILEPTGTNFTVNGTDTAAIDDNGNGTYFITFDPSAVPKDSDGNMDIQITAQWVAGKHSSAELSQSIRLTGLDFQLNGEVTDPETFKVETSANITGTMDMKNKIPGNFRAYYRTANGLLLGSTKWQTAFKGTNSDPTALIHALQYMDYKLADIDLANDPMIGQLNANTVTATYPGTVTIKPANMTIYMGGDEGYDAVVDGTTTDNEDKPSNSMPTPLFYVDVSEVTVEDVVGDITLTGAEGREWKFRLAGQDSSGKNLYYIDSTGFEGQDPVRVAFKGEDDEYHLNDAFDPGEVDELFTTYEISIYSGSAGTVLAQVGGQVHNVAVVTGTLTVRAVEETEDNPVVPVTEAVTAPVVAGSAAVTAPRQTTYTLNNTTVPVTGSGIGLLFDGIIDKDANRTDALVETIETAYDINIRDGYYQAQYLDLVDANNGNAWITASDDVTVYWGYPEGTNRNTKFTLYHFTGLHRDGTNSGFDISDITKSAIEVVDIEQTANGIAFDVEPGGFSPFVLVWEKPSWPIIVPDIPADTTTELLNTYDHDAYIQGYPDGRVKPQNNITRAEVATIFYRLLTDDARAYFWSDDSGFSDVKPGDWYNTAVSTMVNAGILTGYGDGTFKPNASITRAEFATIAARFLSNAYSLRDRFNDTEGHWAEVYINRAAEIGWINGYSDGSFKPDQAITRAEAVTLVNNVLGRKPHADYMLDDMVTWPDNPKSAWYYEAIQEATNSHNYRWSGKDYEIWTKLN